jgi:alkylation response protein AidB-like acyl-CoA dehydrogenase
MTGAIDGFTAEQLEFAELAAKVFASLKPAAAAPDDQELADMRNALAEVGLPLLAVPGALGGGEMGESDVVLILEEAGYADVALPIAETVGVVAPMLARYGSPQQCERWLPAFAGGEALGTTFSPDAGQGTRRGADVALVEREGGVHVVDLSELTKGDEIAVSDDSALRRPEASVPELHARGAWVTATLLNGVSRRLLDMGVEYARTREQFGAPIGSFQAVKHLLAEAASAVEAARPTAWTAARTFAEDGHDPSIAASVAKALAAGAGALANRHVLQVHGGIGFTKEHPLHGWLLYGHELESRWGGAATHHASLGRFAAECDSLLTTFLP